MLSRSPQLKLIGDMDTQITTPYTGETLHVATLHDKSALLAPVFARAGIACVPVQVDTDRFGTFAGEIERQGTVRETLRQKIAAAAAALPSGRLFLASEGTFGPHPTIGLVPSDLETLLLWDRDRAIEIEAHALSLDVVHAEVVHEPGTDLTDFFARTHFPSHGVIVRPEGGFAPLFKGLHTPNEVVAAIAQAAPTATTGRVILATDLRANHNPTRQRVIVEAGEALLALICSTCARCGAPGFRSTTRVLGLPCEWCGRPSAAPCEFVFACQSCTHTEVRPRPDGRTSIDPGQCEFCNP